ncbi:MAG: c-type cytochrome, partial [Actinomycetota bacterium]
MRAAALVLAAALAAAAQARAAEEPIMVGGKPWVYSREDAADIMRACAACHGEAGAGGGGGHYPRLAGFDRDYLAEQLRKFKSRQRENIPMIPFATERELPERDVLAISRYLSEITIDTKPPKDMPTDGYARLQAMKKVLQIPREAGDVAAGGQVYSRDCAACHGKRGEGRLRKPPLAGQHVPYLRTQIDNFLSAKRGHDDVERIMRPLAPQDWNNLWAYVTALGDGEEPAGAAPAA